MIDLIRHAIQALLGATVLLLLPACTGVMGGLYDEVEEKPVVRVEGQLYIDASSWTDWYYIDLKALASEETRNQALKDVQQPYPIPFPAADAPIITDAAACRQQTGIYTYWYDVWGKGIRVNDFRSFQATAKQQQPAAWTLAIHRDNVRTNGGAAFETQLTDMAQLTQMLPLTENHQLAFTPDSWTENAVWTDQSHMLSSLIGSQGIAINPILSSWLQLEIPPIPPTYTHNNHVFIVRLDDGTYGAVQLENYLSPTGKKCCLTINYRYPI